MAALSGVILSAGKGTRIDPFNAHFPKPLLPIGNIPILAHHLANMHALGVRNTTIVVGHLMDRIISYFGRGKDVGMDVRYVEQEKILGIAHAVLMAEPTVQGPFFLCLGDIFYLTTRLERLVERFRRGDVAAVLAVKEETDAAPVRRNFTVELDGQGYVTRVVEKPTKPRNLLKGCGLYVFGPEIFDAIRRTPRTALRDEYEITTSIQILIDDGFKVAAEPVIDWDLNVTFPKDLLDGNLHWLAHRGLSNLVDPTAVVDPSVKLEKTVVGPFARLTGPRDFRECVILADAVVGPGDPLHRTLVSGELHIRC